MAALPQGHQDSPARVVDLASYHLLTSEEAAAILGVPVATPRTCRTRRRGYGPPAVHRGGNIRYRPEDLFSWIESHTETAAEDPPDGGDPPARLVRRRRPHARSVIAPGPGRPTR
ncbi:helix-turn-helix domain-containing protein [Nocardioides sp.]|jgi:hypothetical protein|uniref:helix-turn-helix domain-containing protein n=1 Tax=Nocardioides sp. TaxID=35761 RepID=UPI0039C8F4B2